MVDGSQPQPWHCLPFIEGSTYGLELVYPHETECHVVNDGGTVRFDWDPSKEPGGHLTGGEFIFFAASGQPEYYLFNARLDLKAPPGHVIRTEPHPRYFTDSTGEVPLAMIAHLQTEWYPRLMFTVFRVPRKRERHVFRKGEPYAQVLVVPQRANYRVERLDPEEEQRRRALENTIRKSSTHIAGNVWRNPQGAEFNNHYKVLARLFADGGHEAVTRAVEAAAEEKQASLPVGKSVAETMAAGADLIAGQEYEKAKALYERVLEQDPGNYAALRQLGICVACTGGPLNGLKLMAEAARAEPGVAEHHETLGHLLMRMQRYGDAEAAYRAALRLRPQDPGYQSTVALLVARRGAREEGLAMSRRAADAAPSDPRPLHVMGMIHAAQGRIAEARACYGKALAVQPDYEPARAALAALPANVK